MKPSIAGAALLVALSGCGSKPSAPATTPPASIATPASSAAPAPVVSSAAVSVANPCSPERDNGCGTPDAACATNRLGKAFVLDGVVYTCKGPKPYRWRRD